MKIQGEFSIGFDNEIEDIEMYPNNRLSKRMIRNLLTDLTGDNTLFVGERCKGHVKFENSTSRIVVVSESCVGVGEDWESDKWEQNKSIEFPYHRIRI